MPKAAAEPKNDPYVAIERLVFIDSTALKAEADRRVGIIGQDILSTAADPNPTGNYTGGPIWFWDSSALAFLKIVINGF